MVVVEGTDRDGPIRPPSEDYSVFAGSLETVIAKSDGDDAIQRAARRELVRFASVLALWRTRRSR
jgi:hypothetical protein